MPKIVRWFRVTQDINQDPEMWELREQFGDRAGFVWLEMLSIADRNQGIVGPASDQTRNQLASKCRTSRVKVGLVLDWCRVKGWLVLDQYWRVSNWLKYNGSRKSLESPPNPPLPIPIPDPPKNPKKDSLVPPPTEAIECAQLLSDKIFENFPNRTAPTEAQLMAWARDAERCHRIDIHTWAEIRAVIEWCQQDEFWKANILSMSKLREKWNQLVAKKEAGDGRNREAAEPKGAAGLREWRRLRGINDR